jgi:hypothetical protein
MVQVTVEIGGGAPLVHQFAIFRQHALCQDLQALVGLPPAGGAAPVEDRNAHQLTHRGKAEDAHLARLAGGEEDVILVEFARLDLVIAAGSGLCKRGRRGDAAEGERTGSHRPRRDSRGTEQLAAAQTCFRFIL